jgi:hypothetical protein
VLFGQRLADALTLPLTAFNKLRSGIDWVLEKLGIINKESSTLDQTAAKANAATQGNSYIPATSTWRLSGLSACHGTPVVPTLTRAAQPIKSTCRVARRAVNSETSCRMR